HQVLPSFPTRRSSDLFGNTKTTNRAWGTAQENGLGKFVDFTERALAEIRDLGATHIWYTGVPHHALIRDYTAFGISNDHPDVVKDRKSTRLNSSHVKT